MSATVIIIQARLASTRLPGKVLQPFHGSKTILDIQLQTIRENLPNHPVVIATTTNPADDKIVAYAKQRHVPIFRGSENDVLQRFVSCAQAFEAKNVVRVCSDNPFLMGDALREIANLQDKDLDYFSYKNSEAVPAIKTHWGLFAEFVKTDALERAATQTADPFYHEHVTNYIYGHPNAFAVELKLAPAAVLNRDDLRFTIDTHQDFKTCQEIYTAWDKQSLNSLVALVDENAPWQTSMKTGIAQFKK